MQTRTKTGRLQQERRVPTSAADSSSPAALPEVSYEQSAPLTRAQAELMIKKTPVPDVMQMIDYVTLINRVYQHYPHSDKQILRAAVVEYCRFLALKVVASDHNATILSPSVIVDQVWHLHVLDTKRYESECNMICGSMLHHNPDGGADEAQKQIRLQNTRLLYDAVFQTRHQRSLMGSLVWSHEGAGLSIVNGGDITSPARFLSRAVASVAPTHASASISPATPLSTVPVQSKKRKLDDGGGGGDTDDDNDDNNNEIEITIEMPMENLLHFEKVSSSITIERLKQLIQEKTGISGDQQSLFWAGRLLADDKTLAAYEMRRAAVIYCALKLRGC